MGRQALGIVGLQTQPMAPSRAIGADASMLWHWRAVEEALLDAHGVVKPFDVARPGRCAAPRQMRRRWGVGRQGQPPCLWERGAFEKPRVAAASRGVRLQYVDGARL